MAIVHTITTAAQGRAASLLVRVGFSPRMLRVCFHYIPRGFMVHSVGKCSSSASGFPRELLLHQNSAWINHGDTLRDRRSTMTYYHPNWRDHCSSPRHTIIPPEETTAIPLRHTLIPPEETTAIPLRHTIIPPEDRHTIITPEETAEQYDCLYWFNQLLNKLIVS